MLSRLAELMEDPEPVMRHCRPVEILTDRDRLMRELEAFAGQDRRMGSSGGGTAASARAISCGTPKSVAL